MWNRRNHLVHDSHLQPVWATIMAATLLHEDFLSANDSVRRPSSGPVFSPGVWSPPPSGTVAISVDGAFTTDHALCSDRCSGDCSYWRAVDVVSVGGGGGFLGHPLEPPFGSFSNPLSPTMEISFGRLQLPLVNDAYLVTSTLLDRFRSTDALLGVLSSYHQSRRFSPLQVPHRRCTWEARGPHDMFQRSVPSPGFLERTSVSIQNPGVQLRTGPSPWLGRLFCLIGLARTRIYSAHLAHWNVLTWPACHLMGWICSVCLLLLDWPIFCSYATAHIAMGHHLCLRWTYLMLHNFKALGAFSALLNRATYMFPAGLLTGYYYNRAIIIFGFLALGGPIHVWIRLQSGHNYSWTVFGRPISWPDPHIDVGHFLLSVGRPTRDVSMGPCILSQWTSAVATSEQPNADVVLSVTLQRAAPVCIRPPWATILSLWTQSFLQPGWHIELRHAAWPLLQVTYTSPFLFLVFLLLLTHCRDLPLPLSCPLVSHVPHFSSSSPGYLKNSAPALTLTTNSHLHSLINYLNLLLISFYIMESEILSAMENLTFTAEETGEIITETQQPRPGPWKRSGIEYFTKQIPVQSESTPEASSPNFSNEGAATGTAARRTDSSTAGGMALSDVGHANSNPSQGLRGAGTETNATNLSAPVDATAKGDPLPAIVTAAPSGIEPHVVVVPEAIANLGGDSRTAAKGSLSAAPSESDLPAHGTAPLQVECTISKDLLT
ncbi:hypothetical protein V6N11_035743 [Hibiscus sabdariffa]|uniref:Uncharacterized protein n=1 Tax=Hibiscus sabdariffa TaxID=183260 RepID=A0ABR2R8B5_9ROSI